MSKRIQWLQAFAVILFVCAGLWGVVQANRRRPRFRQPIYQIDVLYQIAAVPGKTIHVRVDGITVLDYTCTPQDAAIAIFTGRNIRTGQDVLPQVEQAVDDEGNEYGARIISKGNINLLAIKAGFAKTPKWVMANITFNLYFARRYPIKMTHIASAERVLEPPTHLEAQEADKVARAVVDRFGRIVVRPFNLVRGPGRVRAHILATSYFSGDPYPLFEPVAWTSDSYARTTDAIKVRLDTYRLNESVATLTYRNAKIVRRGGSSLLLFPNEEDLGSIEGFKVNLMNAHSMARPGRHNTSRGEFMVRLAPKPRSRPRFSLGSPTTTMSLIDTYPTVEELGLDRLNVMVSAPADFGITGFTKVIDSKHPHSVDSDTEIPELRIRIAVSAPQIVSSRDVVLPVHQMNPSGTSYGQLK